MEGWPRIPIQVCDMLFLKNPGILLADSEEYASLLVKQDMNLNSYNRFIFQCHNSASIKREGEHILIHW